MQHAARLGSPGFTSHYHTAVAIHEVFQAGDIEDAMSGLEELIDALSRSEERA